MNRKACLLVVLAVLTLVCVLANDEAAAQAITVTPANPTISVGQTQRFTATGVGAVTAVALAALLRARTLGCVRQHDDAAGGDGTSAPANPNPSACHPHPVTASGVRAVTAIAPGGCYSCALLQDGTVRCWGDNTWGELGNGA